MARLATLLLGAAVALAGTGVEAGWTRATSLVTRRSDHSCALHSSKIYVTGGCSADQVYEDEYSACPTLSNRLDEYNPATDSWTSLPSMPRERNRHVSAVVGNKLYVFGGVSGDTAELACTLIDVYDLTQKTWATLTTTFTPAVSDLASTVVTVNGEEVIMLVGGYELPDYISSNRTHYFKPSSQTFEYDVSNMLKDRGDLCMVSVDGDVYAYGGFSSIDGFCNPLKYLERYNAATLTWQSVASNDNNQDYYGGGDRVCVGLNGNQLVSIGGETKDGNCHSDPIPDVNVFTTTSSKWTGGEDMPTSIFRACGAQIDGKVYVIGGQGELQIVNNRDLHKIHSEVYVWTNAASTLVASSSLAVAAAIVAAAVHAAL